MIIWSGWGLLVPFFTSVIFVVVVLIGASIPGAEGENIFLITITLVGACTGAAIHFAAKKLDGRNGRHLSDVATGQLVEIKKLQVHSFSFRRAIGPISFLR